MSSELLASSLALVEAPGTGDVQVSQSERRLLELGLYDFKDPVGKDLAARCEGLTQWVDASSAAGYFQFLRHHLVGPSEQTQVIGWGGQHYDGINFGSQDYLGLARHPAVIDAASDATRTLGTHSAGSEPMGGGFSEARLLERDVADFTRHPHVVLFPTGWAAGYGAIRAIVRPYDFIVIDALAHNCLQHGAYASTNNVVLFAHNDVASLCKRLAGIRRSHPDVGILVITESLFSMDSDHPPFDALVTTCKAYEASLLVDVAHDLGVLGPSGLGVLGEAGVSEDVDFLIGSFSKVFASIGGFFASMKKGPTYYARGFSGSYTFSNFLIPSQVAAIRVSLGIVSSAEGDELRNKALANSMLLRGVLSDAGVDPLGRVSPMVLPLIGAEPVARTAYRDCLENGVILNNVEFPACRRGQARFRLQVSPRHTPRQITDAAEIVVRAVSRARRRFGAEGT